MDIHICSIVSIDLGENPLALTDFFWFASAGKKLERMEPEEATAASTQASVTSSMMISPVIICRSQRPPRQARKGSNQAPPEAQDEKHAVIHSWSNDVKRGYVP